MKKISTPFRSLLEYWIATIGFHSLNKICNQILTNTHYKNTYGKSFFIQSRQHRTTILATRMCPNEYDTRAPDCCAALICHTRARTFLFCFTFLTRLYFKALRQEVMWGQHCIHKDFKDVEVPTVWPILPLMHYVLWKVSCIQQTH